MPYAVWVQSDIAADGTYVVSLVFSSERAVTLSPDEARRHAETVLAAAHRAEHDAAVLTQLHGKLKIPLEDAGKTVGELRGDRPPLDPDALTPLGLEPCVAAADKRPFLAVSVDGKKVGQWETADARAHALALLEVVEAVNLDAAYHRYLVGTIGIESDRARVVVDDLGNWRHKR